MNSSESDTYFYHKMISKLVSDFEPDVTELHLLNIHYTQLGIGSQQLFSELKDTSILAGQPKSALDGVLEPFQAQLIHPCYVRRLCGYMKQKVSFMNPLRK